MPEIEPVEAAIGALLILLSGGAVALFLSLTAARRRAKRHRKVSASRRGENTRYDLFAEADAPEDRRSTRPRKRRRRRSHSEEGMIDILPKSPDGEGPGPSP